MAWYAFGDLGLLLKIANAAIMIHLDYAEGRGALIRDLDGAHGGIGLVLFMEPEHFGIVHFVDVVSSKHEYMVRRVFFYHINILIDGVGRSLVPLVSHPLLGWYGED